MEVKPCRHGDAQLKHLGGLSPRDDADELRGIQEAVAVFGNNSLSFGLLIAGVESVVPS